jgi:hypothetical protein
MISPHLPAVIVAAGQALTYELSCWAAAHPDSTLAEQETAVLASVRGAQPALLQGVVQTTLRALASQPVRCPQCQHRAAVHDWRSRQVLTSCGPLRWARPWAACTACGQWFGAGDATLGLAPHQQQSAGVAALVTAFGTATAFREAARLLALTTGLALSSESVRRSTEAAGTALADQQDAAVAAYAAGQEAALVDPAPGVLVAETDGVMVRYLDGWHEVKVGVVGGWLATDHAPAPTDQAPAPTDQAPAPTDQAPAPADQAHAKEARGHLRAPSYVAAREESTAFAARFAAEAARRGALTVIGWHGPHQGIAELRLVVVLGDGAKWIWVTAASHFGTVIEIVDYFHACEHLTTVGGLLHGVGSAAATAWAARRKGELWEDGVDVILPQLTAPPGLAAAALDDLRTERGYFTSNAARMQYPAFRAQGLPVGSGAVEGSAKHVIQFRMKRPGARWSSPGGRALLALRAASATTNRLAA